MNVVLASFDPVPAPKGASAHILANLRVLREDHDVSLVTLGKEPLPGERHIVISSSEPNWLRRGLEFGDRCARIFSTHDFDVHHVRSPFEGLAASPTSGIVYEVNAFYSIELGYHYPHAIEAPAVRAKMAQMETALLDRADAIVTTNAVTAQHIVDRGIGADRIRIVCNAPSVMPDDVPPRTERADAPVRLLYIGTLTSWQGVPEVVRVLAEIEGRWQLTIATSASKTARKAITKLARKLGIANAVQVIEPRVDGDLARLLADHDVGLLPLTPCARNIVQGCMPVKLLDYMAAGLPVVAPDMEVVTDVVGVDYPTYRAYSRTSLGQRLQQLIDNPSLRRELGVKLQDRVRIEFSAPRQADALRRVYASL